MERAEKYGPATITRADGEILVCVPTGRYSFKMFRLDNRQYFLLEEVKFKGE